MNQFRKRLLVGISAVLLMLSPLELTSSTAFAKGGRSYSSGRSSFSSPSRSYSSGKSSYSSGKSSYSSKPSTPSYSSGKSSYSSKPSTPSSRYSSGSSNSGKSYTAPSGNKYSSGSSRPSSPSSSPYSSGSSNKGKSSATSSGNSYTSGAGSGNSRQTGSSGFGTSMTSSQRKAASQAAYQKKIEASKPKSTYTVNGKAATVTPTQAKSQSTVRNYVTHERYVTYDNRARGFYGGYYSSPVYYSDPFSPFLFGYMMSSAINSHDRALWMYHHRDQMDDARYQAMLAKDAKLEAEIAALKAQNLAVDPNYAPAGMDQDLQYNEDFIDASLGVEDGFDPSAGLPPVNNSSSGSGGSVFLAIFGGLVFLVIVGAVVYIFFFKDF